MPKQPPQKYIITSIKRVLKGQTRTTLALQQSAIAALSRGINILISLIYVPLLLDYLEPERYGVWLTLISTITWISIFDVGLGNGLRNKLTEALANNDLLLARTYISTTYVILTLIFIPLAIIFYLLSDFINWNSIFNTSSIPGPELLLIVNIVFVSFSLNFIVKLIGVIFKSYQKPSIDNIIIAISSMLSLFSVYLITTLSSDQDMALLALVVTTIPVGVYSAVSVFIFHKRLPFLSPSIKYVDFSYAQKLYKLGIKFFTIQMTRTVIFSSTSFLILHLFGANEVVRYNIAFKLFSLPIMIYTIMLSPVWSATTDAFTRRDFQWIQLTLKRLNLFSLVMVIFIVILVITSPKIYHFWVGNKINIPFNLTLAVAFFSGIFVLGAPYSALINGFGKLELTQWTSIINVIAYFSGVYLFSTWTKGSQGIAFSLAATSFIGLAVRYIQTQKIIHGHAKGIWFR